MSGIFSVGGGVLAALKAQLASTAAGLGATLVGYLCKVAGAVARTLDDKAQERVSVFDFMTANQIGNVVLRLLTVDVTVPLQRAITEMNAKGGGTLYVPTGSYLHGPLFWKSNVSAKFDAGVIFSANAASYPGATDCMVTFQDVQNFTLHGDNTVWTMNKAFNAGEWRHCLNMIGAVNGTLQSCFGNNSGGDGIYVGRSGSAGTHCQNIRLKGCGAKGNRRNGLSVVSVDGFWDENGFYTESLGTSPEAGVDIEPNDYLDQIANVNFEGTRTKSNKQSGFLVAIQLLATAANRTCSVTLDACKSYNDGNTTAQAALKFSGNGAAWTNALAGQIIVNDFQAVSPGMSGVMWIYWDYAKAPNVLISGGGCISPNADNLAVQPYDKCGMVAVNTTGVVSTGNFEVEKFRVWGVNAYTALYIHDSGGPVRNWKATDVIGMNAMTSGFKNYLSVNKNTPNSAVRFTHDEVVAVSLSGVIEQYPGHVVEIGANGAYTLPTCANVIGQVFEYRNGGDYTAEIVPAGADVIRGWSLGAAGRLVMNKTGDVVRVKATAQGWVPDYISWYAQRPKSTNTTRPRKIVWVVAAPTDGTWEVGDLAINAVATVGTARAWQCSVAGTPGTWTSWGNL